MQADFADAVSLSQCCVSEIGEPPSFEDAKGNAEWENAMREGISALKKNETWDLVPLPAGVKPISCKWVYRVKRRSDGSVEQARLGVSAFVDCSKKVCLACVGAIFIFPLRDSRLM